MTGRNKQFVIAGGKKWRHFAMIFIAGMLLLNLLFFLNFREGIERGYPDFTIFYTAAKILREGHAHQLYDQHLQFAVQEGFTGHNAIRGGPLPYNHPPFEAVIFIPLALLQYPQAFLLWDLLNFVALSGVAILLRRSVGGLRSIPVWKFVIASVAFFPVFACLLQGQDSILMLLLGALAFKALKNNTEVLAGGWLGLTAFKFQFVVPLVLLFLIWKRARVALGFGVIAALLALVSIALVGTKAALQYPGYVLRIANAPSLGGIPPELLPNLHGLIMGWRGWLSGAFGSSLTALGTIILFVFAAWKGRGQSEKLGLQFSLAILVSALIAWQTNSHDLSLLILPIVLVSDYCLDSLTQESNPSLLLLILPLLISPLWMVLWLVVGKVNLMAVPVLWWAWKIGNELSGEAAETRRGS